MDWNVFFQALAGAVVLVVVALGTWYLKILNRRYDFEIQKVELERKIKKDEATARRTEKKDDFQETKALLAETKVALQESREQLHESRNQNQVIAAREAACQLQLARLEVASEGLTKQVDDLQTYVEDLENALEANGIKVIRRRRPDSDGHSGTHAKIDAPRPTGDNDG